MFHPDHLIRAPITLGPLRRTDVEHLPRWAFRGDVRPAGRRVSVDPRWALDRTCAGQGSITRPGNLIRPRRAPKATGRTSAHDKTATAIVLQSAAQRER